MTKKSKNPQPPPDKTPHPLAGGLTRMAFIAKHGTSPTETLTATEEATDAEQATHPVLPYEDYEVYAAVLGTYKLSLKARTFHEAMYLAERAPADQWEIEGLDVGEPEQVVNITTMEQNDQDADQLEEGLFFAFVTSADPTAVPDVTLYDAITRIRHETIKVQGIPHGWRYPVYSRKCEVLAWVSDRRVTDDDKNPMCCVCGDVPENSKTLTCGAAACERDAVKLHPDFHLPAEEP